VVNLLLLLKRKQLTGYEEKLNKKDISNYITKKKQKLKN
jgi:hypothetical protein